MKRSSRELAIFVIGTFIVFAAVALSIGDYRLMGICGIAALFTFAYRDRLLG